MRVRPLLLSALLGLPSLAARADTPARFASAEEAVWAGAFREAAALGAKAGTPDEKRALGHLTEAADLLEKGAFAGVRSALRRAEAAPAVAKAAGFWACKMYRREAREREADDCFKKAALDEAQGDARLKAARDGVSGGGAAAAPSAAAGAPAAPASASTGDAAVTKAADNKCSGASCGYGGVPTSPERQKYDEADTKITPSGPSGSSGSSGGGKKP
jgi:hypothetical protein